jgi:hypothetical protein
LDVPDHRLRRLNAERVEDRRDQVDRVVELLADRLYLVERLSEPQDRGRSALGARRRDLTASFV